MNTKPTTIDEYFLAFDASTKSLLQQVRKTIQEACPEAIEAISYGMPAFKYKGKILMYFAGYKNHIGVYAIPETHKSFAEKLSKYKTGKGSVQFPLDQPLPLDLIAEMAAYRKNVLDNN